MTDLKWLDNLISESQEYDTHKADYSGYAKDFRFGDYDSFMYPPASVFGSPPPLEPTDWAWNQIFTKLGPAVFGKGSGKSLPADYLLAVDPDVRSYNLNRALGNANGKEWFVRTYDNRARAVLSQDYATLPNTEVLTTIKSLLEGELDRFPGVHAYNPFVSADDLSVKIIWKDIPNAGNGGGFGIGTYFGNGEIGNRKFKGLPLIKRNSCDNSTIVDTERHGFSFVHRGSARSMVVQLKAMIGDLFRSSAEIVNQMLVAEEDRIDDLATVMSGLAKMNGWDDNFKAQAFIGTEGMNSRAGLVAGISYAAQSLEDPLAQADAEIYSGSILVAPGTLFDRARAYARKE